MRRLAVVIAAAGTLAALLVLGHLALIEVGRDVVTLRTQRADGSWQETRLWIVDDGGSAFLHSGGADWRARFAGDPVIEVERGGTTRRYRAHPEPGPHPRIHQLLREKYGIADRWVRLLGPDREDTLAVRLDPLE